MWIPDLVFRRAFESNSEENPGVESEIAPNESVYGPVHGSRLVRREYAHELDKDCGFCNPDEWTVQHLDNPTQLRSVSKSSTFCQC